MTEIAAVGASAESSHRQYIEQMTAFEVERTLQKLEAEKVKHEANMRKEDAEAVAMIINSIKQWRGIT